MTPGISNAADPLSGQNLATRSQAEPAASTTINPDFTMFLQMLTTQMQNQDPLNPIDSTDFAIQLATFSGVEQQTKTNDLLTGLAGQFGAMGLAQLSGWVGMEARVAAPVRIADHPVTLAPAPRAAADGAVLVVKNERSEVVARVNVGRSDEPIEWTGRLPDGRMLPAGIYAFELENYAGERLLGTDAVAAYQPIGEIQTGATGSVVVLDSGAQVAAGAVTALRPAR